MTEEDVFVMRQRHYSELAGDNSFFKLDKVASTQFGVILTKRPLRVSPERDVEEIEIPGRHGTLTIDRNRYKNTRVTYECALLPELDGHHYSDLLEKAAERLADFLRPTAEYRRLENSFEPQSFQLARLISGPAIESLMGQAGLFSITFECMPQRFLWEGEGKQGLLHSGDAIYNPYQPSDPLITVFGKGDGQLTVGSTVVQIVGMEDSITIDSSTKNAYRVRDDGTIENANRHIKATEFPVFDKGRTVVQWTEGITKIEYIPRWWKL